MKKNMSRMKNTPYTSMVAMRVWVKCMQSKAQRPAVTKAKSVRLRMRLANTYMRGTMATPNRAPMIRQPKGFMPKIRMPRAMMSLPRGGWVHS